MKWYVFNDRDGELYEFSNGLKAKDYVAAIHERDGSVQACGLRILYATEYKYAPPKLTLGSLELAKS